ncbi:MAG: phosphoadenosine phosphosulfate reductase family protein, partial [Pseudomonadales bacterium]|nr:phosphoadenosine phosphosulfate reductase family protein [Pseudomonadales bacterium]
MNVQLSPSRVASPEEIIKIAFDQHEKPGISFSGAEDVVLIDMACNLGENFHVFTLDTGRLHPETYRFIEAVRDYYGIDIQVLSPDAEAVQELVRK